MRAVIVSTVLLLPVLVAGCGHKDSAPSSSGSSSSVSATAAAPTTTQAASPQQCAAQGATQIKITSGAIACADAYAIAAKYDTQGEKVQQVDTFKCETGNADTRPMIFQCVSANAEFGVYPAA
jgi:hypothetical protein